MIIDPDKFVQLWALASSIFPNTSLIISKSKILLIFTIRDRSLEKIRVESTILLKKLDNLVKSMQIWENGLESNKPQINDFGFIKVEQLNNLSKRTKESISNLANFDSLLNPTIISVTRILPRAVLQENGFYKIMIMFENLILHPNLKNTFLALIQFDTSLIIGSRHNGKYKSVLLEIMDTDYHELMKKYQNVKDICKRSNEFSGNLSIVESKLLQRNFLEYSLGLFADSHLPSNFTEIITKLPELLTIK